MLNYVFDITNIHLVNVFSSDSALHVSALGQRGDDEPKAAKATSSPSRSSEYVSQREGFGPWSLEFEHDIIDGEKRYLTYTVNNWVDAVVPRDIVQARCSCLPPLYMFVLTKASYIIIYLTLILFIM